MSLILDALNKAQRERQEQQEPVPQLSTVHYTPPRAGLDKPRHYRKVAIGGGVLALCLAAFLGGHWLSNDLPATGERVVETPREQPLMANSTMQPASVRSEVAAVEPVRRSPATAVPAAPASPVSSAPQDVTQLYQRSQTSGADPIARVGGREGQRTGAETQAQVSTPPVSQRAAAETPISAEPKLKPKLKSEKPAVSPVNPPAGSITALTDLPFVQDLSWATQQKLPSIIYADHRYQESPSTRSVVINGTTYRKGSQIGQGLVLEEILRDGIVLQYQGQRFKLQALNSWVNF